ncbi:Histidine kinase-, DNA gyrase B-, and HSP90-like ATPase [Dyadobacter soli]|uniref:histidine kinase n=1 Tax=Dyadobacter soli TaxID=659014 RepID=A0A1G7T2Y9_9BACT|nr:response regulator [Dyadobacter soli]SDG29707.1 Histidine kinase-, DNA gyrase B-, and HSP90-like ATPase [Dyadobacter soli]
MVADGSSNIDVPFDSPWEKQRKRKSNLVVIASAAYPYFFASKAQFAIRTSTGKGSRILFGLLLVLSSWWQTWFVYLCCMTIGGGLIYLQIRLLRTRAALKKDSEMYGAKIDFYANVSHDARTHLSLIEGRLEKAFRLLDDDQVAKHHLGHARNNSQQLIQLLNELLDYHKMENGSKQLAVSATNSGLGISREEIGRMFDKFFQGNNGDSKEGNGIGLALSKTIVDLHNAKLSVTSQQRIERQEGQTRFSVGFLSGSGHYSSDQFAKSETVFTDYSSSEVGTLQVSGLSGPSGKKFTVLLIEDNDELRAVESELLSEIYHVLEAVNGSEGLKMAFENIPDLILCDVTLPEQNGIQICSQLKADLRTSHIPIILLTGQSVLPQVVQGLQAGADDYLVQPVAANILLLKIQNLIKTRTAIQEYTGRTLSSGADGWIIAGANDEFIDKLRSLVIENISHPNFGVNEMAFQVGVSVSVLYRKVRSLTGMTVNDFMKTIKMQKALRLLESGTYQVNEVALMVGYESVRYFSNEFKKLFGKNPSKFRSPSGQ